MRESEMSKLSVVIFAAALLVGMCSTRSGAYAQNDEEASPPTTAEQPQAPDEGAKEDTDEDAAEGAEAPTDEGAPIEMPSEENSEQ
jgi:hypothetical protein